MGDELKGAAKEKATAMIKEQLGLGIQDELKSAGRDILSSVGDELKGAAKDKAMSIIKKRLGLGMDGGAIARNDRHPRQATTLYPCGCSTIT